MADRDRVDGGAAVGFEGQGMIVEIILDIDRQILFDLDVLLRASVVRRVVRAVVLRSHSCERFKLAAQRFDLSVGLIISAVGQLLDVADGVVVGVAGVEQLQNQRAVASDVAGGNRAGNCAVIGEVIVGLCGCGHGRVGRAFQRLGRVQSIATIEIFQIMLDRIRGVGSGFPLCGEDHAARGDGVGVASLEERFIGCIVCAVSVKVVGIIFSRKDFNAPALEDITFAGRVGGQGEGVAGEIEVVDLKDVVVGVVDSGHARDVFAVGLEHHSCEIQVAGQLVAGFCRIAGRHVLFVYGLVQGHPGDLLGNLVRNAGFEGDVGRQLLSNCAQFCIIGEVQIARQRHCIEGKAADRNVAEAVVAAEAEAGQGRLVQRDRRIELARGQRCKIAVQSCIRVDVVRGDMPLRRQGDIGGDDGVEVERFFCLVQIPAVEGIAGLLGSSRLGRLAFVFHVLREGVPAVGRVEGHDPVVRDRADIICTRRDGVGRPDVVQNVVADLLIGLGRRVQSPLNRFLRQQLVCARCVREVLVVAGLCTGVNVSIDFERCNVAAGNAVFRLHRYNIRVEIDERYGDAVVADTCFSIHAGGMDAVRLAAGCDLGNLAPVGRRMGELDQIVNAGLYRLGCPRIVFPADVPAQRVLGVQVVRRILLERLHKVCDREGHDPCASILAFYKRIVLPGNTRLCGILPLTAVHVLVAVFPEAVDAGDGNKAVECLEDIVVGRLDRRPLRSIGHSLRDRFCNFGLPACEGVAGAGRGAVERGGRGILPKVRIDLIGENFFVLNAVGVGDGVYLRHRYAALLLDLPAAPGPDQRDRNDLLIVLDMFQILERRVELGHIAFGVIANVAKPVVPVLPRLADEVVFIVLAEQTVGFRMLLRIIYDALDQNSHVKLFQLVSRRGFGLADDFNDRYFTLLLPFPVLVTSYFGVIAEGDGQRCVLLVNEPVLGAGEGVICHQIRRYRDRRGDVVALLVRLHIADRILRRGGNIIRLVSMCCFVVLADDSKTAVQRRGLLGLHRRFLVWLRIGVGSADLLIELRNVFRSVQSDGIDVSIFRPIPTEVIV